MSGTVLGLDVSAPMIERARQLTAREGLTNVTYERGDAQVHRLAPGRFDVVISRFGTMFFADPFVAFTNLAGALRPGGRLVMMVWQSHDRNEWATAIRRSLTVDGAPPAEPPTEPGPFSLGDRSRTEAILAAAGFTGIDFAEVREAVYYGSDAAVAYHIVRSLRCTGDLLAGLDAATADRALARLRAAFAAHETGGGVWFDSRAWIITARRAVHK